MRGVLVHSSFMDEIRFNKDKALYHDPDYFQSIAGGFNNIGFGSTVASVSVGWSRSLRSFQMEKVRGPITSIDSVCTEEEALLVGYALFSPSYQDHIQEGIQESLNMHGARWIPAIICTDKAHFLNDTQSSQWAIAYFREDNLSMPLAWYERLSQPVNIFGDVLRFPMATRSCIVQARVAGVILSSNKGRK